MDSPGCDWDGAAGIDLVEMVQLELDVANK